MHAGSECSRCEGHTCKHPHGHCKIPLRCFPARCPPEHNVCVLFSCFLSFLLHVPRLKHVRSLCAHTHTHMLRRTLCVSPSLYAQRIFFLSLLENGSMGFDRNVIQMADPAAGSRGLPQPKFLVLVVFPVLFSSLQYNKCLLTHLR